MMTFARALLIAGVMVACAGSALAQSSEEKSRARQWADSIDQQKPGAVMIGSSMQGEGIDFGQLSEAVGTPVFNARSGGSMSSWKYSFARYVLPMAEHEPRLVIVITRLNYSVSPEKRLRWDDYRNAVNALALEGADRELLDRLAFTSGNKPEQWKFPYDLDQHNVPHDSYYWDFNKAVNTSFLPAMVKLADEGEYQLVYALYKSRKYADEPGWEPPQVKQFRQDMAAWFAERGVIFLDYTQSPQIKADMYAHGDHLSRDKGRPVWTALMAEDLKAILEGDAPPRLNAPESKGETKDATKPATNKDGQSAEPAL